DDIYDPFITHVMFPNPKKIQYKSQPLRQQYHPLIRNTYKMLLYFVLFTLCSVAYAIDEYPMLMTEDVSDSSLCKTGYYQKEDDPCCFYYQCDMNKRKAYPRRCMDGTFWNSDLCACDWDWVSGSCNSTINGQCAMMYQIPKAPCMADTERNECCLNGEKYDNHTSGFGPKYVRSSADPTKYKIPECDNEVRKCPVGTFSLKYCACEHPKTDCACTHWDFENPRPLTADDSTFMNKGHCRVNGSLGILRCSGNRGNPATIPATQKFYLGRSGAIFGKVEADFSGRFTTNGPGEGRTIHINMNVLDNGDVELFGVLNSRRFNVTVTPSVPANEDVEYQWFVITVQDNKMKVVNGVTYTDGSISSEDNTYMLPGSFQLTGNDCPLKLGLDESVYYDFGYCQFGDWSPSHYDDYGANCTVPSNPRPSDGSWYVFENWDFTTPTSDPTFR
ncbi:unnamed protein product, partial [Owenia fusiformis]